MRTTQLSFTFLSALSFANAAAYPPGLYKRALQAPANLTNGYISLGCYVDVGRTIAEAGTSSNLMTNEVCTKFCFDKGFSYAGTEWYGECYCGNALAKGGVLANEADCVTPCNGNSTQPCGGPNRLTLYKTSLIIGPSVNPGVGDWSSIGCYSEGTTGRALEYGVHNINDGMTVAKCTSACEKAGYILAGLEYSGECYCGNKPANGGLPAVDGCNMLCSGNASEYCGGPNRLNVYDFQHRYQPLPVSSTSTPAPTSSSASSSRSVTSLTSSRSSSASSINPSSNSIKASSSSSSSVPRSSSFSPSTSSSISSRLSSALSSISPASSSRSSALSSASPSRSSSVSSASLSALSRSPSASPSVSPSASPSRSSSVSSASLSAPSRSSSASLSASSRSSSASLSSSSASRPLSSTLLTSTRSTLSSSSSSVISSSSSDVSSSSSATPASSTLVSSTSTVSTSSSSNPATSSSSSEISSSSSSSSSTTSSSTSSDVSSSSSSSSSATSATSSSTSSDVSSSSSSSATSATSSSTSSDVSSSSSSSSSAISSSTSSDVSSSSSVSSSSDVSSSSSGTSSSSIVVSSSSTSSIISSTSSSATPTPTGPSQPAVVGSWKWYGCQTEAQNARALNAAMFGDDAMTIEKCVAFCAGYTFAGVEWSRECWCGNSFMPGSKVAPSSDCSMTCTGNKFQYCGEGNRLSVYTIGDAKQIESSSSSSSASTSVLSATRSATGSTSSTSASATPSAAANLLPAGWERRGCWVDNANGRILPFQAPEDAKLTIAKCAQYCESKGYTVAGAEWFTQCFCGNAIYGGGVETTDIASCSTPCGGNDTETCGGPNRMNIISKGVPVTYAPPVPQKSGLNGSWTYEGCVEDNVGGKRTFGQQTIYAGTLTAGLCLDACAKFGYMAAGLEYGEECYCGDPANIATAGAKFVDESRCSITCAGNATGICGGLAVMTTYFWTGTPLYSWNYATGDAAGKYEDFIGGKCIPLMTMESITGKVTFLEKWGTGPPNSTGAYELDVSLAPDLNKAWREMHVKTDVFCSAGLTLPDKAGRQMNIGGWSGDSTYGVRLYTPSGSKGVNGTTDWEEDPQTLRLQDGRWYPSAMIMANGSIFVIGGEEGSNGAAVPTIEVLPYTGTAPLFQQWLLDTDPNNLYPFIAVLPSEDIFVAYWNEARILDKVTFETKTLLPKIPGSVTNPEGGRTYPLEGTGVLLPQRAPYDEPLGVLICGGSGEGAGIALDNCVTIEPEGAKPTWTIERMPSRRVMSCIAPLPDGTYLINNGAQQGVAGFGLANTPNHNALLYDPTKPLGSRISVLANTTISRLYHSESITLLDGRVLVTGSDPEDGVNPQEYRTEVFYPPYLMGNKFRPTFTITNKDWAYGGSYTFNLGTQPKGAITASLLGAVSSTHGNSMGARTIFPAVSCNALSCTVQAPPRAGVAPPGWYQFFVLEDGIPAVGVYVRVGGDPAGLGDWPKVKGFTTPGV